MNLLLYLKNMNNSDDVVNEPWSAFCDCALSGGDSLAASQGEWKLSAKGESIKWGREMREECVGVYRAASEAPSSTIT